MKRLLIPFIALALCPPAQAMPDTFNAGYHFGMTYGAVSAACLNHHYGSISTDQLLAQLKAQQASKKPYSAAIDRKVLQAFQKMENAGTLPFPHCFLHVRTVFSPSIRSGTSKTIAF